MLTVATEESAYSMSAYSKSAYFRSAFSMSIYITYMMFTLPQKCVDPIAILHPIYFGIIHIFKWDKIIVEGGDVFLALNRCNVKAKGIFFIIIIFFVLFFCTKMVSKGWLCIYFSSVALEHRGRDKVIWPQRFYALFRVFYHTTQIALSKLVIEKNTRYTSILLPEKQGGKTC